MGTGSKFEEKIRDCTQSGERNSPLTEVCGFGRLFVSLLLGGTIFSIGARDSV